MISAEELNLTNTTQKRTSHLIKMERQRSSGRNSYSIKSSGSSSSKSNIRNSIGSLSLDLGNDLNTNKKKMQKLEQLCGVLKNKKHNIVQKQQELSQLIIRKEQLSNRIRTLEEQKLSQNISDQLVPTEIKKILQMIQEKRKAQIDLKQSIQSFQLQIPSTKLLQQRQVSAFIKQNSQLNQDIEIIEKELQSARIKSCSNLKNSLLEKETIQITSQICNLQNSISQNENILLKNEQDRQSKTIDLQELKNILQTKIVEQQKQVEQFKSNLKQIEQQQKIIHQGKLNELIKKNRQIVMPQSTRNVGLVSRSQQKQTQEEIEYIQKLISHFDLVYIYSQLQTVQQQQQKTIFNKNQFSSYSQNRNLIKIQENNSINKNIEQIKLKVQNLSRELELLITKKQQLSNNLNVELKTIQPSKQQKQYYTLQKEIEELRKRLRQQKNEMIRIESLAKQFVSKTIIDQYKLKNESYRQELQELRILKSQSQQMSKEIVNMKQQKQLLEWTDNDRASDLQNKIISLKAKKQKIQSENKELKKKLNQSIIKVKQYKETYPDFQIIVPNKSPKSKQYKQQQNIEKNIQLTKNQYPRSQMPKTKKSKNKKIEIKQQNIRQNIIQNINQQTLKEQKISQIKLIQNNPIEQLKTHETINSIKQQISKVQANSIIPQTQTKTIKNKKQQKHNQQIKQQNILVKQSSVNSILTPPIKKSKNNKKDKNNLLKKQYQSQNQIIQKQLEQFTELMKDQSTKSNYKRLPQIIVGALVLLSGSTYWLFA